jgi:glutaredoxin 3
MMMILKNIFRRQFAAESGSEANKLDDDRQHLTGQAQAASDNHGPPLSGSSLSKRSATMGTQKTPDVTMYTTRHCPYCVRARILLEGKGIDFKDIAVDGNPTLRQEMVGKSMNHTVPQIWIGDEHIGGCDELYQLERQGELDALLSEISYE